jgi:hypothetical protein
MSSKAEEIMAMNLRVIQQDQALKKTERIVKSVRFAVMARYDEDSKHWNYLRYKGPLFMVIDTFGTYRLVILNHCSTENYVIPIKEHSMKFEVVKLEFGEGYMLNYLIKDTIRGQSVFGIWSADETLVDIEREIQSILKGPK